MRAIFRAKSYAQLGSRCNEYQELKSRLPKEGALHAWYRDAKAGWIQHRYKYGLNLASIDVYGESGEIPIAACRYLRFINDQKASEVLGPGAFFGFCEVQRQWYIEPGDRLVGYAAGLRRTAEQLRGLQIGRRTTNADRLGIVDSALFELMWGDCELRSEFLDMLHVYDSPSDAPDEFCNQIAARAAELTNQRLDTVDRTVFGDVTPHLPSVFMRIIRFWQFVGMEWMVARDALSEFRPD